MTRNGYWDAISMVAVLAAALVVVCSPAAWGQDAEDRPNVLWITTEDMSPDLGSYGSDYAVTPTLDRFAERSVRYTHAFATSGVCAPSRSCLIMGVYPSSLGSQHMRSRGELPGFMKMFPGYLREAGYYCTNNRKEDYNLPKPPGTWDESSRNAHYKNREEGQPFFAVFNITTTHESKIRANEQQYDRLTARLTDEQRHDPAGVSVPPYHPDTPEVRGDWAQYADMVTAMDYEVGDLLDELEEAGLAEDTIVFFYSDHGAGMPRGKRWLWDSGIHVPLIVHFPEKYGHLAPSGPGTVSDRLVSFVDFGPTVLSLAGVEVPEHMQGRPFLGEQAGEPREYVYGLRGRMDERYDMVRAVRDKRYKYIRNFMPHLTYDLHLNYMYEMPTMRVWKHLHEEGLLPPVQDRFFTQRRAVEELYDTEADPHEVRNLASDPRHRDVLERMRGELFGWMAGTRDVGLLAEPEIKARPARAGFDSAWEWARSSEGAYPLEEILDAARVSQRGPSAIDRMIENLSDEDPAVRFWSAVGLNGLNGEAKPAEDALMKALGDKDPSTAAEAAHALIKLGHEEEPLAVLAEQLEHENEYVRLRAAIVLDRIDGKAKPVLDAMKAVREEGDGYPARVLEYAIPRIE